MHKIPNQIKVDDPLLVFLYREVLFPWEVNYQHQKFLMPKKQEGFKEFCVGNNIIIESRTSSKRLEKIQNSFNRESNKVNGLFRISNYTRIIRGDSEYFATPKCLLYHLRNAVAHASFGKKTIQGIDYLYFESWFRRQLKIQAQVRISLFPDFMKSLVTTEVK